MFVFAGPVSPLARLSALGAGAGACWAVKPLRGAAPVSLLLAASGCNIENKNIFLESKVCTKDDPYLIHH